MRIAIVVLCALAIPAFAQSVPSKTLERGIKLYDKRDFYSASLEFQKVLDGTSGDDAQGKQRAEFFMAKSLYNMGFYAAAASRMSTIAQQGTANIYSIAIAKWIVAVYRVVPAVPLGDALFAYRGMPVIDDPILAGVRDDFAYYFGRELARRDIPKQEAVAILEQVSPNSPLAAQARLEIERIRQSPAERSAFEAKLRAQASPPFARYHASRQSPAGVPVDVFDAVMIPTACHEAGDLAPTARKVIEEARVSTAKLLAFEDNAELGSYVLKLRKTTPQPGNDVVLAMMVDARIADQVSWAAELDVELEALRKADRAWQTTQVAADVLQELVILQSLQQADLGKLVRDRLEKLDVNLAALSAALRPGMRLDVPRELCGSSAATIATPVQTVKPQSGCAGCATRDARWSAGVLAALLLLRRRARRR